MREFRVELQAKDLHLALVAARFNNLIVERLIAGAEDFLVRHGALTDNIDLIRVAGAFELPLICQKLASSGKYQGIVALGAVIRGSTPHFDYICSEATKGLANVMLQTGLPIGFGLLTCDSLEQALDRAGGKSGNKGADAAASMLESIRTLEQI